ncbi:MAG: UvrD-helicase domain-containing protein [Treponema sp.]|nr:UvrD-helicase domain-containing protein [Treponema sp.]
MHIIADLHIHSRFSRATSKKLTLAHLDRWAAIKGIDVVGSGDCTHPAWLAELKEQLEEAEPGFYTLKESIKNSFNAMEATATRLPKPFRASAASGCRFVLTGEISSIYKKGDRTRKIHHLVLLPDIKAAETFQSLLERVGNIHSDGRPILGVDSRDVLRLLLDADDRSLLIPAHIWTPWFSALGAKSGFDSIDECYGDLASYIPSIETGLSSNPPMNWALSSLDRFSIISNSDAHSPDKLGREATIFEMDRSYSSLSKALRLEAEGKKKEDIAGTIEFYPQEGKYHYAGHRKCGVSVSPEDAALSGICPRCGKPLTGGVINRVLELADRPVDEWGICPPSWGGTNRRPYVSLIPLRELLGEVLNTGCASKKVDGAYTALIEKAGGEIGILMDMPIDKIGAQSIPFVSGELLAQAVTRMRAGHVFIQAGYDGEYGVIRVFDPRSEDPRNGMLFREDATNPPPPSFSQKSARAAKTPPQAVEDRIVEANQPFSLDAEQKEAVSYTGNRALVIAGPGTGKTATLSARIAHLVQNGVEGASILAITFTVKAAVELRERIAKTVPEPAASAPSGNSSIVAATFHALCTSILREQAEQQTVLFNNFRIIDSDERDRLLQEICREAGRAIKVRSLGDYIDERKRLLMLPHEKTPFLLTSEADDMETVAAMSRWAFDGIVAGVEFNAEKNLLYGAYQDRLRKEAAYDFDDLVTETVRLFAEHPHILSHYRKRFRFIFVDEYQDINFAQYALIRLLTSETTSLWVIGDPNQAIYAFRGADKRFIAGFKTDYPEARIFHLTRSFRCAAPIIAAAGRLVDADIQGVAVGGAALSRSRYASEKAEAEAIARKIAALIGGTSFFALDSGTAEGNAGGVAMEDCVVLVRAAILAEPIATALADHGIPCKLIKEQDDTLGITVHGVRLMTIHASKGLEAEHVFIPALEDGILPFTLYGDTRDSHIEEERRLLYVAMTRAKRGLYLSWVKKRIFQHRVIENEPSRFLNVLEPLVPLVEERMRPRCGNAPGTPVQMDLF